MDSINWQDGTWQNSQIGKAQTEIAICSDWAPIRGFEQIMLNEPLSVYGDLVSELQNVDMRVVNLECPLSDQGEPVFKSGAVFKTGKKWLTSIYGIYYKKNVFYPA